jgi:hypothetical protein
MTLEEHIEESKKLIESKKKLNDNSYELIANLYSDPSHFIFELIQNCEDAYKRHSNFKGIKEIVFELFDDSVDIYHNGKPFDESDLKSISTFADSTKKTDINQIGKFGIGFKSVFYISDTPYIYSRDNYSFKLNDFIILEKVAPKHNNYTTTYSLPFKEDQVQRIHGIVKKGLENLNSLSLLFLDQISQIVIKISGQGNTVISKIKKETFGIELQQVVVGEELFEFIMFSKQIKLNEKLSTVKIAYHLKDGIIIPFSALTKPALFVHFLTGENTELEFLIHGPFSTTPSREKIPFDEITGVDNLKIAVEISELFIESLNQLKKGNYLSVSLWQILPIHDKTNDVIYNLLFERLLNEISSNADLIPNISNGYTNISDGLLAGNKKISKFIFSEQDLKDLFNKKQWIDTTITEESDKTNVIWDYFQNVFKVKAVDIKELIKGIETQPEFIRNKSDEWFEKFYVLLLDLPAHSLHFEKIKSMKIIRSETNNLIEAFINSDEPNAFLDDSTFPDKSRIVKKCFLKNDESRDFIINRLGLKAPDRVDFILNSVLLKYTQGSSKKISKRQNTDDINTILKVLEDKTISGEKIELLRNAIKDKKIIMSFNSKSKKADFKCPSEVYLFTKQNKIYFKNNPSIWFPSINVSNEKLEKLRCIREIKINTQIPRPGSGFITLTKNYGYHKRGVDLFDPDAQMDGLLFALRNINKERSKIIWNTLIRENNYKKVSGIIQKSKYQNFLIDETSVVNETSIMGKQLTEFSWIYIGNKRYKPSDLFLKDIDLKSYDTANANSKILSEKLGFKYDMIQVVENSGLYKVIKKKEYDEWIKDKKGKAKMEEKPEIENEPNTPINPEPTIDNSGSSKVTHREFAGTSETGGGNGSGSTTEKHDVRDGTPREKRFFDGLEITYLNKGLTLIKKDKRKITFKDNLDEIELIWCNSETANRVGYDFEIKRNGQIEKVIELKSTMANTGNSFTLTGAQWDKARDMHFKGEGEKYEVFCIYNAHFENPLTASILDPYGRHYNKELKINEVNFTPKC